MANQRILRVLMWWRKWAKREWVLAAVGFVVFLIGLSFISDSRTGSLLSSSSSPTTDWVPLTLLRNAKQRGAFCLDGSLPGYHFQKGFGSGSNNWILHIEGDWNSINLPVQFSQFSMLFGIGWSYAFQYLGGGWCNTLASCSYRKTTALGSSKYMEHQVQFAGILSYDRSQNPDFFNWNKVKIRYCDGASFAGHPETENKNGKELFFRGQLIWEALMDELLQVGLSTARQALLSGCSAGGLATLIHCDDFRGILPKAANVKCLSDAGFFLNEKDIAGNRTIESFYHDVVNLQGVATSLHKHCVERMEPSKCFFPREILGSIKTPVFLVNPAYDFWQIRNILVPAASDTSGSWSKCRLNIQNCNSNQIEVLQGFQNSLLSALSEFQKNKQGGMFINSCFIHCQTWMPETWHAPNSPRVNNKTIAETVGDWFFEQKVAKQIDCPYPCNPTCFNIM